MSREMFESIKCAMLTWLSQTESYLTDPMQYSVSDLAAIIGSCRTLVVAVDLAGERLTQEARRRIASSN